MQRLENSIRTGDVRAVRQYLRNGGDPNLVVNGVPLLLTAVINKRGEILNLLLETGADVEIRDTRMDSTALILAAAYGSLDLVHKLVEKGANIRAAVSASGHTALYAAALSDHLNVVRYLAEHEAGINAAAIDGATPL